jgi:O-antigen ligase/polysaccharide polymerase Wzy-like membrane protein
MEAASRQSAPADRGTIVSIAAVVASLAVLTAVVVAGGPVKLLAPVLMLVVVLALSWRALTPWPRLLATLVVVILFIPIRRYSLPFNVGIQMEPYRLLVAVIVVGWVTSLLIDQRVRIRRTGFEGPIVLQFVTVVASLAVNHARFASVQSIAIKQVSFLFSFFVVVYVVVSVIGRPQVVDGLVKILVGGGAVVAFLTLYESRAQYNIFDHLQQFIPLLRFDEPPDVGNDGRGYRAYASAQHPIALGAGLVMLIPLAVYLIRSTGKRRWWLAAAVLLMGALVTRSRTAVLVLVVIAVVYAFQRPKEVKRLWPALLPMFVALHFAAPGTIGTIKGSLFPQGGIVASESQDAGTAGSGRVADLGPGIKAWKGSPFVGEGYGTRVVDGPKANAPILDDQWLTTLLESGALGMFGWIWLFVRAHRRFTRAAKRDSGPRGWLFTALAASSTSYAISMATYDSFAFIQVSFLLFLLLGLGAALLRVTDGASGRAPAVP